MAWRPLGIKQLSEPMIAQFTDAYASFGLNEFNSTLYGVDTFSRSFFLNM